MSVRIYVFPELPDTLLSCMPPPADKTADDFYSLPCTAQAQENRYPLSYHKALPDTAPVPYNYRYLSVTDCRMPDHRYAQFQNLRAYMFRIHLQINSAV